MPSKLLRYLFLLSSLLTALCQDSVFPEVVEWAHETITLLEKELEVQHAFSRPSLASSDLFTLFSIFILRMRRWLVDPILFYPPPEHPKPSWISCSK